MIVLGSSQDTKPNLSKKNYSLCKGLSMETPAWTSNVNFDTLIAGDDRSPRNVDLGCVGGYSFCLSGLGHSGPP